MIVAASGGAILARRAEKSGLTNALGPVMVMVPIVEHSGGVH